MKMSYRQDNLRRVKKIKIFSLFVISGIVFYFFSNIILNQGFNVLSFITLPIWRLENGVRDSLSGVLAFFETKDQLQAENYKLASELDSANLELGSLHSLEQENEQLMVEMGRQVPKKATSTLVAVLSGPNIPPYEDLIIDVGKNYGVSVGDRVIYEPNVILGEVNQVFERSAKVKLYSASGVQTDILIPSTKPWHAVAIGYGGGNFYVNLPISIAVATGAQILIPGSNLYTLGVVDYVKVDQTIGSEQVLIRYPINIKNLRFVHVIKSANGLLE